MKNKKNVIIISMVAMIAVMIVGYAAFSASLKINGLANIESNWNILFTNIEIVEKTSGATETLLPEATGTSATFSVNLKLPGDYIEYEITVENRGTLGAIVESINASETGNDAFTFEITNIAKGDRLAKESSTTFNVKVTFDEDATSVPVDHNKLTLEIMYVQDVGQSVGSEDIIITGSTLTTLSGNTTLSLANSAGRKLANYTISGNSVQNGTPTPDAPVEIQSVGNKTSNLFQYIKPEIANGTVIETLSTGAIVDGNDVTSTYSFSSGWFRPGNSYKSGNGVVLNVGDKVTLSADVTLLELGVASNESGVRLYFYSREKNKMAMDFGKVLLNLNETIRISKTVTLTDEQFSGDILFPIFGINSHKMKIENIMISIDGTDKYEPYGKYKIPIEVSGKNLINKENSEEGYFINSSGNKTATGSYGLAVTEKIYVKPSTTYVYSGMGNVTGATVMRTGYQYDAAGNPINAISSSNGTAIKFTTEANCAYVLLQYVILEEKPMLEEGTAATEYEPYVEPTTYNIFLDEPLRCISGVCDTIDFKTKNLTRNIKEIVLTGEENWSIMWGSEYNTFKLMVNDIYDETVYTTLFKGYSNQYKKSSHGRLYGKNDDLALATQVEALSVIFRDSTFTDTTGWKKMLTDKYTNGNPVIVGYQLASPMTTTIDLPRIQTTEGTSNISINLDNGISVPISVEYYKTN